MKTYQITEEDMLKLFQAIEITKQGLGYSNEVTALQATTALVQFNEVKESLSKQMLDYSVAKPDSKLPSFTVTSTPPAKKRTPVKRTKKVTQ